MNTLSANMETIFRHHLGVYIHFLNLSFPAACLSFSFKLTAPDTFLALYYISSDFVSRARLLFWFFHGKLLLFNAHIICIAHDDAEYFIPNEIRARKIINAWCHFSDAITRQIYKINRFLININHMLMTSDNILSVRHSTTASNYNLLSY